MRDSQNRTGVALSIAFLTIAVLVIGGLIAGQALGLTWAGASGTGRASGTEGMTWASSAPGAGANSLSVDVIDASVEIYPSGDGEFRWELPADDSFRVTEAGNNELIISQEDLNLFFNWRPSRSYRITVWVPEELDVLDIASVSGGVSVQSVSCKSLNAHSTSGRVELEDVTCASELRAGTVSGRLSMDTVSAPSLRAETTSGSLSGSFVAADDVKASTMSGGIDLELARRGKVDISTVSGSLGLDCDETITGKISTVSGSVRLRAASDQTVRFSTLSGSVRDERAGDSGRAAGKAGVFQYGEDSVSVETTSGSIRVE